MGKYLTPRQWGKLLGGVAYKNKIHYGARPQYKLDNLKRAWLCKVGVALKKFPVRLCAHPSSPPPPTKIPTKQLLLLLGRSKQCNIKTLFGRQACDYCNTHTCVHLSLTSVYSVANKPGPRVVRELENFTNFAAFGARQNLLQQKLGGAICRRIIQEKKRTGVITPRRFYVLQLTGAWMFESD